MKNAILTTAIVFFTLSATAQDTAKKIKVHAVNAGFGGFSFKKDNYEGGGASFIADVTLSYDKNLASISYLTGAEIGIIGGSEYSFNEVAIQYGREFKATNWLRFEGFAGVGYYTQKTDYGGYEDISDVPEGNAISFPLRINTKFYFNKRFGMGINTNYSINDINNNFSANLLFHLKFD